MSERNVVIVDGAASGDKDLSPILSMLSEVLKGDGARVKTFPLREMKLAHCLLLGPNAQVRPSGT